MTEPKTGAQIVTEFFESLRNDQEVDRDLVDALIKLYSDGKFTPTQISNALEADRKKKLNDKN